MLQEKCPHALLLVSALLMVSCDEDTEDQGVEDDDVIKPDVYDFAFNSTNVTHFVYGIAANAVAVLLYGSNYVPVKRIETGDGMFFQWVNCAAIWLVSMVGDLMLHSPKFYPLAMLGGVIWATGNIAVVPVLKASGLALGMVIWGSCSLLMGWASSRFGWFGIDVQEVSRPVLNDCGAGLCVASGLIFFFVKTNVQLHPYSECTPLLFDRRDHSGSYGPSSPEFWIDTVRPKTRRFIGCLLAVVSGLMYGSSFVPILYIKSHSSSPTSVFHGASVYDLDYVYAQCSGIFLTSTIYFTIYCGAMNNKPRVYSRAILPDFSPNIPFPVWVDTSSFFRSVTAVCVTRLYQLMSRPTGGSRLLLSTGLSRCESKEEDNKYQICTREATEMRERSLREDEEHICSHTPGAASWRGQGTAGGVTHLSKYPQVGHASVTAADKDASHEHSDTSVDGGSKDETCKGLLSGLMWILATYCWFLANNYLSAVDSFPIVSAGYGLVAALWGSLVFREIRGFANCLLFVFGLCVVLAGSLLIAFSKFG